MNVTETDSKPIKIVLSYVWAIETSVAVTRLNSLLWNQQAHRHDYKKLFTGLRNTGV